MKNIRNDQLLIIELKIFYNDVEEEATENISDQYLNELKREYLAAFYIPT